MSKLTTSIRYRSATVDIEIQDGGAQATAKVISMGEIKFDFDLQSLSDAVKKVSVLSQGVSLTLYAYDSAGNNIFDRFQTNISDAARVVFTIRFLDALNNSEVVFSLKKNAIEYDELDRVVKLQLSAPVLPSDSVTNIVSSMDSNEKFDYKLNNTNYTAVSAGYFINRALSELSNAPETVVRSGYTYGVAGATPRLFDFMNSTEINICATPNTMLVLTVGDVNDEAGTTAFDAVRYMAAVEGAIFGVGFDKNFYINRLDNTENVVISNNQLKSLKFKSAERVYSTFEIGTQKTVTNQSLAYPRLVTANTVNVVDDLGRKGFTLKTDFGGVVTKGAISSTVNGLVDGDYVGNSSADIEQAVASVGIRTYQTAFNRDNRMVITGEIIGCEKVKPYQCIKFDSTLSERFQNKHFRPSYLYYDLENNVIKFKAYEI